MHAHGHIALKKKWKTVAPTHVQLAAGEWATILRSDNFNVGALMENRLSDVVGVIANTKHAVRELCRKMQASK